MRTWLSLGYLGLLPFIICLVLVILGRNWQSDALQVFIFYSAIILSFLSGTLWQVNTKASKPKQQIISNIFCLMAFLSLLIVKQVALITLALSYLLLFIYERHLIQSSQSPNSYLKMRLKLTTIVVLLHGFALFLL